MAIRRAFKLGRRVLRYRDVVVELFEVDELHVRPRQRSGGLPQRVYAVSVSSMRSQLIPTTAGRSRISRIAPIRSSPAR